MDVCPSCGEHRQRVDPIEAEYIRAMSRTSDSDQAYDLSIGLRQYREMFKIDPGTDS